MSPEAGKRPPETRSTTKNTEFRVVFGLILIENGENSLRFLGRYKIRHLCRASLADFCPDTSILRELASKVYVESDGRKDVVLDPYWVDFILTSANTWQRPIEDFTLIIERPKAEQDRKTLVSFCSPMNGTVEKLDADHFQVHLTNLVPTSELHIGFFEVPVVKPGLTASKKYPAQKLNS